jgi:hypothetical protein
VWTDGWLAAGATVQLCQQPGQGILVSSWVPGVAWPHIGCAGEPLHDFERAAPQESTADARTAALVDSYNFEVLQELANAQKAVATAQAEVTDLRLVNQQLRAEVLVHPSVCLSVCLPALHGLGRQ